MKRNVSLLVILLVWIAAVAPQVLAQSSATPDVPRIISYQGLLSSAGGQSAADGPHLLKLELYTDASGSSPAVWSDTFTAVTQSGVFSVLLGSQAPLPPASIMAQPLWLGVQVDGVELRPLSQLSASPYALSVPNGSITSEKLATNYVGSLSINGSKVTGKGTDLNLAAGPGLSLQYDPTTSSVLLSSVPTGTSQSGKGSNPLDLSNNYVQNRTDQQSSANFNIDGSGTIGSNLLVVGTSALQGTATLGTSTGATAGMLKINDAHTSDSFTAAITGAAQYSANRTYTLPDVGANANFVMSEGAQTINGNKTFGNNIAVNGTSALQGAVSVGTASGTSAGTISINDATSSSGNTATISGAALYNANRTYTLPDVGADANFVMSEGAQTINGSKTFGDNMTLNQNLTVQGTSALQGATTLGTANGSSAGSLSINDANSSTSNAATVSGAPSYAANRNYTLPDVGADANFVMSEGAQTINGAKTFGNDMTLNSNLTVQGTSALQGAVTVGTGNGATSGEILINDARTADAFTAAITGAAAYSANRTYTLPDVGADANFVMSEGDQTINGTKTFGDSVNINGTLTTSHVVATQSIIPQADTTISLGDPTHRFKDLYLSGHSLVMGSGTTQTQFETDPSGGLVITNTDGTTTGTTTLSTTGTMTTSGDLATSGTITTGNSIIVNGTTTPRSVWSDATLLISTDDSLSDGGNILIKPSGGVGIGVTYPTSPDALLEVNGSMHVTGTATFDDDVAFSKSPQIPLHQNRMYVGNASNKASELNSQNSSVLVTDASGAPGWSTTLPANLSTSGISNTGTISSTSLTASGSISDNGTLSVTGNTSLDGALAVTGASTLTGGATFGSALSMGTNQIHNLADPSSAADAATKNYVDTTLFPPSGTARFIENTQSQQNGAKFNIGGNGTIGGNLTVSGSSTLAGTLSVTGASTFAGVHVNGPSNATSATSGIVFDVENTGSNGTALQAGATGSGTAFAAGNSGSGFAIFATNTGTGGVISANASSGNAITANANGGSGIALLASSSGSGNAIVAWANGTGNAIAAHGRLDMSGDTIENVSHINNGTGGTIAIDGNTDFNNHNLSNLGYVTLNSTSTLSAVSGTLNFASNIDVQNHNIYNLSDPSSAQDAATKNYVDTHTVNAQHGGTGINTSATGTGSLLYTSGTGTWSTLSPGSQYKVLTSNGTSAAPSWGTPPGTAVAWGVLDANHSGGAAIIDGGFNVGSVTTGGGPFYSIAVTNAGSYSHYMVMVSWYGGVGSNMGSVSGNLAGWWDGSYIDIADYVAGGGGTELTPASYISFVLYGY